VASGGGNPGAPDRGAGSGSRRETRAGPKGGAPPPPKTDEHEPRGEREERGKDPEWEKRERESAQHVLALLRIFTPALPVVTAVRDGV